MKSIAFFNNKGGVGKTTLACNIASAIAKNGSKVLLIDCDPQCNSTLLIMGDQFVEDYYQTQSESFTIKSILRAIEDGDADITLDAAQSFSFENRFNIDLIPGHPYLSAIEDILSDAWQKLKSGDLGGTRKTNWCYALNSKLEEKYNYIFYDLGPSLGALNRTVLHGCSHFITPMGVDIFSLIGIENIQKWINHWTGEYTNGLNILTGQQGRITRYPIKEVHTILSGFIGYTLQQYITKKTKDGERRPTKAYELIADRIDPKIQETLGQFSNLEVGNKILNLGQIPHLYSLIPLSQSANAPIHSLIGSDGLIGSQIFQRETYVSIIESIAAEIVSRLARGDQNA